MAGKGPHPFRRGGACRKSRDNGHGSLPGRTGKPLCDRPRNGGLVRLGLQQRHKRGLKRHRIVCQVLQAKAGKRRRPVEGFGNSRFLFKVFLAQRLNESDDLAGKLRRQFGPCLLYTSDAADE